MNFKVIACQIVSAKNGKNYYRPSVILDNGAVHTFFTSKPYKTGDDLHTVIRQLFIDGRQYLVVVPSEG